MARKNLSDLVGDKVDQEAVDALRAMFVSLGRAVSLSCVAAMIAPGSTVEDRAIEAMDNAWTVLIDKIILFAVED